MTSWERRERRERWPLEPRLASAYGRDGVRSRLGRKAPERAFRQWPDETDFLTLSIETANC